MEIRVHDIPAEGHHLSYVVDQSELEMAKKELVFLAPVQVAVDVFKHGQGEVYCSGMISTRTRAECSRCLETISCEIHSDFHLEYAPSPEVPSVGRPPEREVTLLKEIRDVIPYHGDQIDIGNEIMGQFFLSVPTHPLCQPNCLGLCSQCGENLNRIRCDCDAKPRVLRWADLKHFKYKETHAKSKT